MKPVYFERAIFLGWYCSKRDCSFCYMSTIKPGKNALRSKESVLAEALICKKMNWKIEFLSAGYNSYSKDKLLDLVKEIYGITKQKQWLNIGTLTKEELNRFKPYIEGVSGSVECVNLDIRNKVCPSKHLDDIIKMLKDADDLGLKKAITIIIGIGETINDFDKLKDFIKKHKIDKIIFYALNPHENSVFKKGPAKEYYVEWIRRTRKEFPKLKITAGSWMNRFDEINSLLKYADNITKFPSIKLFNSRYSKKIIEEVKKSGRTFKSNLSYVPDIKVDDIKLERHVKKYIKLMKKEKL